MADGKLYVVEYLNLDSVDWTRADDVSAGITLSEAMKTAERVATIWPNYTHRVVPYTRASTRSLYTVPKGGRK